MSSTERLNTVAPATPKKSCRDHNGVCRESGHVCSSGKATPVELVGFDVNKKQFVGLEAGDIRPAETE